MIKRIVVIILLLIATPFLVICQTKPDENKDEREVRQTDNAFHQAIKAADVETLGRLLANRFIWTHSTGNIQTKEVVIGNLQSGKLKYELLDTDEVKVYVYGKTAAVVSGHSNRKYPDKDRFELRYSVFYVKQRGKWQIVAFHTSILPKP